MTRWFTRVLGVYVLGVCVLGARIAGPAAAYVTEILIPAGPFHGVHGLSFGPKGELYDGDIMGLTVHRVDIETGNHRPLVGPPDGMADDVAVAPTGTPFAGTIVWTSIAVGRLHARAPDGAVRVVADNLPSINTVVFAPDGRLYATQMGGANALWRIDLSGGAHEKLWDDTGGLNGFVVTADNILYGPQGERGTVIRLDLATRDIKVIADGFAWPTAVKMDRAGTLYVGDLEAGTVWTLDKDTGAKALLATIEPGLDNLTIGPNGKVYVSSITRNGIFEIDPATKAIRTVVRGRLTAPGGVAVLDGATPRIFVADMYSLREVDAASGADRIIAPMSRASVYPSTVSAFREDGKPRLIVTGFYTNVLAIIDPDTGDVLRRETGFAAPRDAIHLDDGSILVAETGAKRLTLLAADGTRRRLGMAFEAPAGLTKAPDGALYVSDAAAGTLLKIDLAADTARIVAGGFGRPEGIAAMADGAVLVVDSKRERLSRVDPATGKIERIADALAVGLEAPPPYDPTWIHNGVAVDAAGAIYLTSDRHAALYKLAPKPTRTLFRRSADNR